MKQNDPDIDFPEDEEPDFDDDEEIPETRIVVIGAWLGWIQILLIALAIDVIVFAGVVSLAIEAQSPSDRVLVLVFGLIGAVWIIGTTQLLYKKTRRMLREGAGS